MQTNLRHAPRYFCELGLAVIETEAKAVANLAQRIDEKFSLACDYLLQCQGRIIVMGIGKSGHIANKIASTLASTGSPAFFVHPGEAAHGDMGMIRHDDVIIAVSNSGKTEELVLLLPLLKRLSVPLISLTGNAQSLIAQASTVHIDVSVEQEACPFGLAPTSSTTAALVMGDALAIALLQVKGFTAEDFALSHPGGQLGRQLLLRVEDLLHTKDEIPIVSLGTTIAQALIEITRKKLGMTCVVNSNSQLVGIFTDGDIRRVLNKDLDIHTTLIDQVMSSHPKTIKPDLLAAEALQIMQSYKITSLIVMNDQHIPQGVLHLHDLLRAGVI
jgi:arabinose-5-phosphate isomerase